MSSRGAKRKGSGHKRQTGKAGNNRKGANQCYNCGEFGHFARECNGGHARRSGGGRGPSGSGVSNRDPERRFFDKVTKDPEATIDSAHEATRLLKAALTFAEVEGGSALLYRLTDRELNGCGALKSSLEYLTEVEVFVHGFLPLVDLLGRDELHKPVYSSPLNYVIEQLYSLPFLVDCIAKHCSEGLVETSTDRTSLIWFFTVVCLAHDKARINSQVKSIVECLGQHGGAESLKTILGGNAVAASAPSLSDVRLSQAELPGGRHDNDKEDFRSISIIPTLQEFLCDADPYLPKIVPDGMSASNEAALLDRHFRLLREDILGPSKEQQDDPRKERKDIVYGVRVDHVETGSAKFQGEQKKRIMGQTNPCISFRFRLPQWMSSSIKAKGKKEKEDYWERHRKFLPKDALVCLQRRDRSNEWVSFRFATIVRRQPKELAYNDPLIGLAFLTEDDTAETLKELSDRGSPPTRLFVISGDLFAYAPILRGLQMMPSIPFAEELVRSEMTPSDEMRLEVTSNMSSDILEKVKMLDAAQNSALNCALQNRVALIQGPPGTGKTFIGVLLAQIMLAATTETILCVTYTNHALDDFVEDLLDVGITDIVRLGGRSQSDRLSEYNLRELASSGKTPFTREQNRRFAQLKGTIDDAEEDVARIERVLRREIGDKWWKTVGPFLQGNHPAEWRQLHLTQTNFQDSDGFRVHGIGGDDHLWKCWLKGKSPPEFIRSSVDGDLWKLSKEERKRQKIEWQHELYEDERAAMATALATIQTSQEELKQLQQITDSAVLSRARVVACTTTKAAMCKSLLDGLAPGIVLVEEAAEIMEPHVLTSLNPGTKRLIMIGDHKQLRPKCQHYPLTVESGRGFDLNRSLFERLASMLPISTLEAQHRMHPVISEIPRLITYPNLKDAPSVSQHPAPMGLAARIMMINHDVEEDRELDSVETMESVSRTNLHEVELVVGIVRYLFQQGYNPSDLVVLTPYLGQMVKIQNRLAKDFDVFVDDRDFNEARDQLGNVELVKRGDKGEPKSLVRVATIDNYQGEEAKIVVVSLVRSNDRGEIGFLKEPERVNVMLSRARECEIIIGNRSTFESARGSAEPLKGGLLWKKIFGYLEKSDCIFIGLPAKCQRHGTLSIIERIEDFCRLCPDGGCHKQCDKELTCGHICLKKCHIGSCSRCNVLCPDICPRGHDVLRQCSEDLPHCKERITWKCELNHLLSGPCYLGKKMACQRCNKLYQEAAARKATESELQALFDSKYDQLEKLKARFNKTQEENRQKGELEKVEREIELLNQSIESALREKAAESTKPNKSQEQSGPSIVNEKVRSMLVSAHPDAIDPNVLMSRYKKQFGTDLQEDLKKSNSQRADLPRQKKRRKLKELLADIDCCEIVMDATKSNNCSKYLVCLRDDPSVGFGASLSRNEAPKPKRQRVPPNESIDHQVPSHELGPITAAPFVSRMSQSTDDKRDEKTVITEHGAADDANIIIILERYESRGALSADDLVDQMYPEARPVGVAALVWIIHNELDPHGSMDLNLAKEVGQSELSKRICAVAKALSLSSNYPQQARLQARVALDNASNDDIAMPKAWIEVMNELSVRSSLQGCVVSPPSSLVAAEKWKRIAERDKDAPSVMRSSILPMIGLEEVKEKFINMYHRLQVAKEQGDSTAASYNVRFEGNPGTGKTTIARHYGKFLREVGVLDKESIFRETTGANLIHQGVKGMKDILEDMKDVGGGVVFVDEAYQLVSDNQGKKILDFILPLAESLTTQDYGKVVWVFAGYKKQMEKMFEYNDGLPSRFPLRYVFQDYSDDELQRIFEDLMTFKAKESKPKEGSRNLPRESSNRSFGYSGYQIPGSTATGRKGGTWTYDQTLGWTDKYGNMTVDPKQVGKRNSELVCRDGNTWTENNGTWTSQSGQSQSHYPGSPPPSSSRVQRDPPFHCANPRDLRIVIRRLGRSRGENGFGNARAVRVLFERVRDRQATRITEERGSGRSPDVFAFAQTDLLGPRVTAATLKNSDAWKELEAMEGLLPVKESVEQLFSTVLKNVERERREEKLFEITLNRLFLGSPGTGKTTVAKLYGQILADLGLLSKGEVIAKCASDFIGEALGTSEKTTNNIIKAAEGCVLVIDEAYSLYSGGSGKTGSNDPYKTAVIDTIVEKVQARPGANIAVIMLGYQEEMEEMMRNVNPGLSRRFQIENAFLFPDFDDASLCRIMMASARQREVRLTLDVAKRAVRTLAKARAKPNFGNAGSVDNLLSKAIIAMQSRKDSSRLTPADFGFQADVPNSSALSLLFDDLIGCTEIRRVMDDLRATVEFAIAQGADPKSTIGFNYLFLGNPGTGKTTIARRMGKLFHGLGLLASDELREAKASDLLTGYSGQAGKKTRELLEQSRGGVLFIDEAYQLNPSRGGNYMTEAVDELVGALTSEEFKGKILVILAGYEEDMEEMLRNTNPGMRSRFSERVHFADFDADSTFQLFEMELKKRSIPIEASSQSKDEVIEMATRLVESADFGNGRDIVSWADRTYKAVAKQYSEGNHKPGRKAYSGLTSSTKSIREALDGLLESRQVKRGGQKCAQVTRTGCEAAECEDQKMAPPPQPVTQVAMEIEENQQEEEQAAEVAPSAEHDEPDNLFESVDASVLKQLQDFVDEEELGSEEGTRRLATLDPNSQEFADLVGRLRSELNMTHSDATAQLLDWQSKHKDLEEQLTEQAIKTKKLGVRPIWRCGVCGRADKPWIACYVAPFIVGYEKVPIN